MKTKQICGGTYVLTAKKEWPPNTYQCDKCGMLRIGFGHLTNTKCDIDLSNTIEKVTVTYSNGSKKEFNTNGWFLFEEGIRKMAKGNEIVVDNEGNIVCSSIDSFNNWNKFNKNGKIRIK